MYILPCGLIADHHFNMLKRTKGYLLLTLLVLTGLAGRMHMDTLSAKERRMAIRELKTAKASFTDHTISLTEKQLKFRPQGWELTIEGLIKQHTLLQEKIWQLNRIAIKREASVLALNHTDALSRLEKDPRQLAILAPVKHAELTYQGSANNYLQINADMLRFLRTTTDNVRAHEVMILKEKLDAYQLLQLSAVCTLYYCRLIDEFKNAPGFPL